MKSFFKLIITFFMNLFSKKEISEIEVNEPEEVKPKVFKLTESEKLAARKRKKAYRNGNKRSVTTKSFNHL